MEYKTFNGAFEKVFFNHKELKEDTKNTKVKTYISALYDLCDPDSYRDFVTFVVNGFQLFQQPSGGQ